MEIDTIERRQHRRNEAALVYRVLRHPVIANQRFIGLLAMHHPHEMQSIKRVLIEQDEPIQPIIIPIKTIAPPPVIEDEDDDQPLEDTERRPTVKLIVRVVCDYYGVTLGEVLSQRRDKEIVRARQVAHYLSKALTTCSLVQVGRFIGGRDHTTIMHSVRKMTEQLKTNLGLVADMEAIKRDVASALSQPEARPCNSHQQTASNPL